ncbi:MAG TPA: LamG domain-containing protein [Polyangiaceae bacterium]
MSTDGGTPTDAGADAGSDAGAAATIIDSIGGANGTPVNVALTTNGSISLVGGQYVSLPAGIISSLGNSATFEAWVTWTGGPAWQRIFDFGSSDQPGGIGPGGVGLTYVFVTPLNGTTSSLRGAFTLGGPAGEASLNNIAALPTAVETHVALVVDGVLRTMSLYENGVVVQVSAPYGALGTAAQNDLAGLSGLNDVNNWLGRSQYAADPGFDGSISEFRIYSVARSASQIMASFVATSNGLPAQ